MGFKIDITADVKAIFESRAGKITKEIEGLVDEFGLNTVSSAKRRAPVDKGLLRSLISYENAVTNKTISVDITVATNYAAYIEFGTRKFAAEYVSTLPNEWKEFAAKFQGKGGGSYDEFIMRLVEWVQRKGIGGSTTKSGNVSKSASSQAAMKQAAYAIALHILRNGIRPHPFLYPAIEENRLKLLENIKKLR